MTAQNTAQNEQELLETAQELAKHVQAGGTIGAFIDLDDDELEAIYAVGYNQFAARKFDQAINIFKLLCLYDHLEERWYYSLGVAQQGKGDYEAALKSFSVATILDMMDPNPQAQAAYCLMALGHRDEAKSALEGAIIACQDDPEHATVKKQAEALLETLNARETKGAKA